MSIEKKSPEIVSLNSVLLQLHVEELEKRLETDPLMIGGLLDASTPFDVDGLDCTFTCNDYSLHCGWYL